MTWLPSDNPVLQEPHANCPLETIVVPRVRDLGGFEVRRVLPSPRRRMVGPFIFLDQMGAADVSARGPMNVRPHPHIGLATVTYLIAGSIHHRDSLGSSQLIVPGDVNWMSAGQGIVHSERSESAEAEAARALYGLQLWVALPDRFEESTPTFAHHDRNTLPTLAGDGVFARLIAGQAFGLTAPVATFSDLFQVDVHLQAGRCLAIEAEHEERAIYLLAGRLEIDGFVFEAGRLLVLALGRQIVIRAADAEAHMLLLGGEPMEGPRYIWWNFVSSRVERIEQAKADWARNRFDQPVPGEHEFIPLPEDLGQPASSQPPAASRQPPAASRQPPAAKMTLP